MFEDKDLAAKVLAVPLNAQAYALDEIAERFDGKLFIADPNSPFCTLLEYGASLMKVAYDGMDESMRSIYERRAQTMSDLFRHMSDFDYLNLFSTPCPTTLQLTLNRVYLTANAKSYNDNYRKVIIPQYTMFTIGKYQFGIHYPIEIRINKATGSFLATWNTDTTNPLHALSGNLLATMESEYGGLKLLHIDIPVQQFFRSFVTDDLIAQTGYSRTMKYNYKFWAIRIFTEVNGLRIELKQTLAKDVYDMTTPTARVIVDVENQTLTVDVPQVYFTNKQMGKKLYMEVYTTFGAMDIDISGVTKDAVDANFNLSLAGTSEYSRVLNSMPTIDVVAKSTTLVGGGDGYGFDDLRQRVVNNTFYKDVPITPSDLDKYFTDRGFSSIKFKDNITDRIYHAHRVLVDSEGLPIPATNTSILVSEDTAKDVTTILSNPDGSYTILPTTMYAYDQNTQIATPLKDSQVEYLGQLTKADLVDHLNSNAYTYTPFHTWLSTAARYTRAVSYNLLSCDTKGLNFIESNDEVAAQILILGVVVQHLNGGTDGYQVEMIATKSSDIQGVAEDLTYILVDTVNTDGHSYQIRAEFNRMESGYYVYRFKLETDYWFDANGRLNLTNLSYKDTVQNTMLNLENQFNITCLLDKSAFDSTVNNNTFQHLENISDTLLDSHIVLLKQSIILHLGHSLSDVISNEIDVTWSNQTYAQYALDVPATYKETVYQRDAQGNIVYEIVDGEVVLDVAHELGDPVLDAQGNPVYEHKKGDYIYDDYHQLIVVANRAIIYQVALMQFDAKIHFSEDPQHITFRNSLATVLEGYFDSIRQTQDQLLERTYLYFRPTKTMGTCAYSLGNGLTGKYPLALSFNVTFYVQKFVDESEALKESIRKTTLQFVSERIATGHVGMVAIFEALKTKLSDYIVDVDVSGINHVSNLQTLVVSEDGAQPILAQKLSLSRTGHISLVQDISILFVVSDTTR